MFWGGHRPDGPWIVLHMYYLNSCSLQGDEEEGPMFWGGHRPDGPWIVLHMYYFSTVAHYRGTRRRDPWSGVVTILLVPGISSICVLLPENLRAHLQLSV